MSTHTEFTGHPPTKTAYQILTDAQELVRDPAHWTRGTYARDAHGRPVAVRSAEAVRRCGSGAILCAGGREPFVSGSFRKDLVELFHKEPGIVHVNDDEGHEALMALFDRLRAKAKALEVAT